MLRRLASRAGRFCIYRLVVRGSGGASFKFAGAAEPAAAWRCFIVVRGAGRAADHRSAAAPGEEGAGLAGRAVVGGIVVIVRAHAPPAPGHPPHGLCDSGPQAALAAGPQARLRRPTAALVAHGRRSLAPGSV